MTQSSMSPFAADQASADPSGRAHVFDAPSPVSVVLDIAAGDVVRLVASPRADVAVEVLPVEAGDPAGVRAAEHTHVELKGDRLVVRVPRAGGRRGVPEAGRAVSVSIELPEGSAVTGEAMPGVLSGQGRLGRVAFEAVTGRLRLDQTGSLHLDGVEGEVSIARVDGPARVSARSGRVRIDRIEESATIRNKHGETGVGRCAGPLRLRGVTGSFHVRQALGDVDVSTAFGDVRLDEVRRGAVVVQAPNGAIDVGVREGSAAWLELRTVYGELHNTLTVVDGPGAAGDVVQIRAYSVRGDVAIGRARPGEPG